MKNLNPLVVNLMVPPLKDTKSVKYAFILGLGTNLYISLIGYLSFAEIVLVLMAPFLLLKLISSQYDKQTKIILAMGALWLCSAILVDIYRATPLDMAVRGWARVSLILFSILVFYRLLLSKSQIFTSYLVGFAISATLGLYVFKGGAILAKEEAGGEISRNWSHYYNYAYNAWMMAFCFLLSKRKLALAIFLLVISGVLNIFLGSRASGGVMLVASVIAVTAFLIGGKNNIVPNRAQVLGLIISFLVASVLVFQGYSIAAERGLLGEVALSKFESQSVNDGGLILGGRTAVLAGALAVIDSPIVGYGSWAQDNEGFMVRAITLTGMIPPNEVLYAQGLRLPAHSHLLEGWTEHGIAAGLFWLFFAYQLFRFGTVSIFVHSNLLIGNCLLLAALSWSILFSPVGNRVYTGAFIAYILVMNYTATSLRQNNRRIYNDRMASKKIKPSH